MQRQIAVRALHALCVVLVALVACDDPNTQARNRAIEVARSVLSDEGADRFDRLTAAGVMLDSGSEEGRRFLEEALESAAPLAHRAAIGAILSVRGEASIESIREYAHDDGNLRTVLEVLRFNPRKDAVEFVHRGMDNVRPAMQVVALDAAALLGDPALLPRIETLIERTKTPQVRGYGAYAASALGSPEREMIESLLAASAFEREVGAACLGFADPEWAVEVLQSLLDDRSGPGVRIAALASLVRLGQDDAVEPLIAAVLHPDGRVAALAAGSLRRLPADRVVELAGRIVTEQGTDPFAAGRVLEAVGWARGADASSVLTNALAPEQDELVRLQGLWAVGWRGIPEERHLAERELTSESVAVRTMAAWAVLYSQDGGYEAGTGYSAL